MGQQTHRGEIAFRGVQGRTLADQAEAVADGYESVAHMAIDELARRVIALELEVFGEVRQPKTWAELSAGDPED